MRLRKNEREVFHRLLKIRVPCGKVFGTVVNVRSVVKPLLAVGKSRVFPVGKFPPPIQRVILMKLGIFLFLVRVL